MRIAIVGAMEEEITILRSKIVGCKAIELDSCNLFYTGQLGETEVVLLKSGIGKVAAAIGTVLIIERCSPDLVINTGSAGSLTSALQIGDIVVPSKLCYHDTDVTAFGYKLGQMPGCPMNFKPDETLINEVKESIKPLKINMFSGLVVSGDTFVNSYEKSVEIRQKFPEAIAVEMEATAIAQVCYNFKIPLVVVRAISDIADQTSQITFNRFLSIAAKQSSLMVEELTKRLSHR